MKEKKMAKINNKKIEEKNVYQCEQNKIIKKLYAWERKIKFHKTMKKQTQFFLYVIPIPPTTTTKKISSTLK